MVLYFSLLPLISNLDANKHSNKVEHINWVLSELSVGVYKMLNRIGRTCISLFTVEHFSFHAFYKCGLQRDLMSCSSCLTLQRR